MSARGFRTDEATKESGRLKRSCTDLANEVNEEFIIWLLAHFLSRLTIIFVHKCRIYLTLLIVRVSSCFDRSNIHLSFFYTIGFKEKQHKGSRPFHPSNIFFNVDYPPLLNFN